MKSIRTLLEVLAIVLVCILSSCDEQPKQEVVQQDKTRYYKVKDLESNTVLVVKSVEPARSTVWVYTYGDTVLVSRRLKEIKPTEKATKAIILSYE